MKCKVTLTNSNTLVRELYTSFAITEVNSKRVINCKAAKREGHTDLSFAITHTTTLFMLPIHESGRLNENVAPLPSELFSAHIFPP